MAVILQLCSHLSLPFFWLKAPSHPFRMRGFIVLCPFNFRWLFTSRLSSPFEHLPPASLGRSAPNMPLTAHLQPLLTWACYIISALIISFPSSDAYRAQPTVQRGLKCQENTWSTHWPQFWISSLLCLSTAPIYPSPCLVLLSTASGRPQWSFSLIRMFPLMALFLCTLWFDCLVLPRAPPPADQHLPQCMKNVSPQEVPGEGVSSEGRLSVVV